MTQDELGVQDLRGFIKRLPPVLGQPVDWELRKKLVAFQELTAGDAALPAQEALESFPGFFAHSLHDRIIPRLEFCRRQGRRLDSAVLLRVALTGGDAAFAKDFIQCAPEEYESFFADYKQRTKQQRAERNRRKRQQERRQAAHQEEMQTKPSSGAAGAGGAGEAYATWAEEAVCD